MDEIRNIVGPNGPYYLKTLYFARMAMEQGFYYNPGKYFRSIMAKCGLDHSCRNELFVSLENPQFNQYRLRFDADIPDPKSSKQKENSPTHGSPSSSTVHQDRNAGVILIESSSSPDHQDKEQSPIIIDESSDDLDEKLEKFNAFETLASDESSHSSLEEGELSDNEDDIEVHLSSDVDKEQTLNSLPSNIDNRYHNENLNDTSSISNKNYKIDNRKRKMTNLQNGNMDETGTDIYNMPSKVLKTSEEMECLQCELCGAMQNNDNTMMEHLKCSEHYSASKVKGTFFKRKIVSIQVMEESCLVNPAAKYKTLVPICPECHQIFPTIFMCAMHFKVEHNKKVRDCYSVGKVTKETICKIDSERKCQECNRKFSDHRDLWKHWNSKLHWPYSLPDKNEITVFFCPYCDMQFYKFELAFDHTKINKHKHLGDEDYSICVRYIEASSKYLKLLPSIQLSDVDQKLSDLKKINMMKMKTNQVNGRGPQSKRLLAAESENLTKSIDKFKHTKQRQNKNN